jgi:hypothetical protein
MTSVDQWLAQAAEATQAEPAAYVEAALLERLAGEESPNNWAARRESRHAVVCAAMAAVVTFGIAGWLVMGWSAPERPTWVAAPSPSLPYVLLVGHQ